MDARAVKFIRALWAFSGVFAVCAAVLTACDFGGSAPPPASTPSGVVTGTLTVLATGPTDTPRAPTETPPPSATPVAAPTAPRSGNPIAGQSWRLIGLTGQNLFTITGPDQKNGPIYVGGLGIFRSDDQGATWAQLSFDNRTEVQEIHVSPSNPNVIYAGTGTNCAGGIAGAQFRSDDGGTTWTQLPEAPSSLQVDRGRENEVTAMSCQGVVRSTDGGATWEPLPDPLQARLPNYTGALVRVAPTDNSTIYATYVREGGNARIRSSTDAGATWTGAETDYLAISDLLIDAKRSRRAWGVFHDGALLTNDSGTTWTPDVTGLDAAHNTVAGDNGAYQLSTLEAQYNTSGDLVELYIGTFGTDSMEGTGIYASRDFGSVWTRFGGDLGGSTIHQLHVVRESDPGGGATDVIVMYAATSDGVFKILLNSAR